MISIQQLRVESYEVYLYRCNNKMKIYISWLEYGSADIVKRKVCQPERTSELSAALNRALKVRPY